MVIKRPAKGPLLAGIKPSYSIAGKAVRYDCITPDEAEMDRVVMPAIDAVKGAFEAMIAGKLNVSVECSPLLGPQLMSAVKDIKAGKAVPKRIVTEEGIFPMEVAAKEMPNRKY